MPKSLLLCPEISTLREMSWQKKEAMIIADVYNPDSGEIVPYAPRNILKETVK
jgi:glutamine synthetase